MSALKLYSKFSTYESILKKSFVFTNKNLLSTMSQNKPKVYLTRALNVEAMTLLNEACEVTMWPETAPVPRDILKTNIKDKDGLLCMLSDKIDKEILEIGNSLKVISTMSVGYDHLSLTDIKSRNIKIGYTPDILTDATAELTVALLLATGRRLLEANDAAKTGHWAAWSPFWMCGPGLSGSTVGIVGFGRIGQEVGKRLKPFNVKQFLYTSRKDKSEAVQLNAKRVDFDELLKQSDFVIATCALTPETEKIFNKDAFEKMKNTAVFVNSSRGGVVDQEALVDALKNDKIFGAGLDVMTPEPLPVDHPLFGLKNCVILPHIGSASIETRRLMADMAVRNLVNGLKGEKMPAELV